MRTLTRLVMRCACGADLLIGEAGLVCGNCDRKIIPGVRVDPREVRARLAVVQAELDMLRAVKEAAGAHSSVLGAEVLREIWPERVIECQDMSKVELP